MALSISNDFDNLAPREYSHDYGLEIRLARNPDNHDPARDWVIIAEFRCHDLLQMMRQGLFWTTSNVVPERGFYDDRGPKILNHRHKRIWQLNEFVDGRPDSQCRWVGTITLYANSVKSLADFRLHTLEQRNISWCVATNRDGKTVFQYGPREPNMDINCFDYKLQPSYESWWFWPMERVLDYETMGCGATTGEKALI